MTSGYLLRTATQRDAAAIARHRGAMFLDMGAISEEQRETLVAVSEPWMLDLMAKGEYLGWLVESGQEIVAGGGVLLRPLDPEPGCLRVGRWAHIANVYTEPGHRRRGLARMLMLEILDWCAANSMDKVTLNASEGGRALYASLGFVGTENMRLVVVES